MCAFKPIDHVYRDWPHLSAPDKAVATFLAYCAHPDGTNAFPGIATTAKGTGYTERTVRKSHRSLQSLGVIAVQRAATNTMPTVYCFPGMAAGTARGERPAPLDSSRGERAASQDQARGASSAVGREAGAARGEASAVWGERAAPKPLLTAKEPPEEPTSSRTRDTTALTTVQPVDELEPGDRARLEQEWADLEAEDEAAQAYRAAETKRRWEARYGPGVPKETEQYEVQDWGYGHCAADPVPEQFKSTRHAAPLGPTPLRADEDAMPTRHEAAG